jgi:hypothetical protein
MITAIYLLLLLIIATGICLLRMKKLSKRKRARLTLGISLACILACAGSLYLIIRDPSSPEYTQWNQIYLEAECGVAGEEVAKLLKGRGRVLLVLEKAEDTPAGITSSSSHRLTGLSRGLGTAIKSESVVVKTAHPGFCTGEDLWLCIQAHPCDAVVFCGTLMPPFPPAMLETGGPLLVCCESRGDYLLPLMEAGRMPFFTGMQQPPQWDEPSSFKPKNDREAFERRYRLVDLDQAKQLVKKGKVLAEVKAADEER